MLSRFSNWLKVAASIVAFVALSEGSHAQSVRQPAGMQRGEQYRVAFVTDGGEFPSSADNAFYNAFVTQEANGPGSLVKQLDTQWFAIVSTMSLRGSQAIAKIATGTDDSPPGANGLPIYLLNGTTRIANDYDDLWDGTLLAPLNLTPTGQRVPFGPNVWTGTNPFGTHDKGLGSTIGGGTLGYAAATDSLWISGQRELFSSAARYYAISGVLTAVPEPSCAALLLTHRTTWRSQARFISVSRKR